MAPFTPLPLPTPPPKPVAFHHSRGQPILNQCGGWWMAMAVRGSGQASLIAAYFAQAWGAPGWWVIECVDPRFPGLYGPWPLGSWPIVNVQLVKQILKHVSDIHQKSYIHPNSGNYYFLLAQCGLLGAEEVHHMVILINYLIYIMI